MKNIFFKLTKMITPKTELEILLDNINELKNNPDNYGKVAMMYYKLQNIHAILIGRNGDDSFNLLLVSFREVISRPPIVFSNARISAMHELIGKLSHNRINLLINNWKNICLPARKLQPLGKS